MAGNTTKRTIGKAREHAISVYCEGKAEDERKAAIRDLHEALCKTQPYAKHMQASDITVEEMYSIVEHLRSYGWAQAVYMPIASFCSAKPLGYLLSHKQELLGNKGQEAFTDSYGGLRKFFVGFFGNVRGGKKNLKGFKKN